MGAAFSLEPLEGQTFYCCSGTMNWSFNFLAGLLLFTSVLTTFVALLAWKKRNMPGGTPVFLLMLAVAEWNLAAAFEVMVPTVSENIFWAKLSYLGIAPLPLLYLLSALEISRQEKIPLQGGRLLLLLLPLLILAVVFSNDQHLLYWTSFSSPGEFNLVTYGHGPLFWVVISIIYASWGVGSAALIWAIINYPPVYHIQFFLLTLSAILPFAGNILYVTNLVPVPGLDVTPILFGLSGMLLTYGMFRHQLFNLLPVARHAIIENMADGVIVTDRVGNIADINPSARQILNLQGNVLGSPAFQTLLVFSDAAIHFQSKTAVRFEAQTGGRTIEVRFTPIFDRFQQLGGHTWLIQDITLRKQIEEDLLNANSLLNKKLQEIETLQISLKEQSMRDPLTQLFSRRFLNENIQQEFIRARRSDQPVSVIMLDIDHFKRINDTYGHIAGDLCLIDLARLLQNFSRCSDIICRYGGDEFILVLPDTDSKGALTVSETLRKNVETTMHFFSDHSIQFTISLGIATFPVHGTDDVEVIHRADEALYRAKQSGRNRSMIRVENTPR